MPSTIGIIGYGNFGAFLETLAHRFVPDARVRVYSARTAADRKKFFSLADTAASDVVFLAVPIHSYERTVARALPLLGADSILVDVATVKTYTVEILERLAPGRSWMATHPMFGPESYQKRNGDISGMRIVIAEHTLPRARYAAAAAFLRGCGFEVVEMSAQRHDKHLAETLFLTHFIGQIVSRARFNRTEIDTVSFGYLMDAAESVKHDTALFQDVYRYNPYCEEVLRRFEIAEHDVHTLLKKVCIIEK